MSFNTVDIRELNERIERQSAFVDALVMGMNQTIVGQKHLVESLLIGLLSDGHVLLEGVPGLAKTLAIKTLAQLIDAQYSRIQFTPDLLPSEVTGINFYNQKSGDFVSKHIYFTPIWVPKDERCYLLSEFGGFSRPIQGHMLRDAIPFGYRMYFTKWRLQRAYKKTYEKRIIANIPRGLSACVFTQLSDVEGEINGLITYDRRVDKMDRNFVKSVNDRAKY